MAALKEMKKWPEGIRAYYWPADTHIFYVLSMVHSKLSLESSERELEEAKAREYYEKAEEIYQNSSRLAVYEYADIIERIRNKANEVLSWSVKDSY